MAKESTSSRPRPRRGDRLEIVVSSSRARAVRGRLGGRRQLALLRLRGPGPLPVEGELIQVRVERLRASSPVLQIAGTLLSRRLVVASLGIQPLALELGDDRRGRAPNLGRWPARPADRIECEMERRGPEKRLTAAFELWKAGARARAARLLREALGADIRCLDAHARLGYFAFCSADGEGVERALRHYRTGLKIGQLSLGPEFEDLLPWRLPGNRPYLRCLYGYGLCLWRLGDLHGARVVMRRLCRLSPDDQLPARLALQQLAPTSG